MQRTVHAPLQVRCVCSERPSLLFLLLFFMQQLVLLFASAGPAPDELGFFSVLLLLLLLIFSTHLTRATWRSNGSCWCCWSGRIVISLRCLCVDLLEVERGVKCCCCCCCSVCLSVCQVAAEASLQEFISHSTKNYTKAHCKGGFFFFFFFLILLLSLLIWHVVQCSNQSYPPHRLDRLHHCHACPISGYAEPAVVPGSLLRAAVHQRPSGKR